MGRYRKVDSRIWNDAKFRSLSDNGKLVFFFLLTHQQMTSLGAMRATLPGMAQEMHWPLKAFAEAFVEAFRKGMVKHDERASFVWLPNFIKYNRPESPNVVKAWASALDLLPECEMQTLVVSNVKVFLEDLPKAFGEAFMKALAKSMPNPEQEPEQEQEQLYNTPQGFAEHQKTGDPEPECVCDDLNTRIETIYNAYPRHVAKPSAFKAIRKALEKCAYPELLERTQEFASSEAGQSGSFTPHPATWFNQERYADNPSEWKKQRSQTETRKPAASTTEEWQSYIDSQSQQPAEVKVK